MLQIFCINLSLILCVYLHDKFFVQCICVIHCFMEALNFLHLLVLFRIVVALEVKILNDFGV